MNHNMNYGNPGYFGHPQQHFDPYQQLQLQQQQQQQQQRGDVSRYNNNPFDDGESAVMEQPNSGYYGMAEAHHHHLQQQHQHHQQQQQQQFGGAYPNSYFNSSGQAENFNFGGRRHMASAGGVQDSPRMMGPPHSSSSSSPPLHNNKTAESSDLKSSSPDPYGRSPLPSSSPFNRNLLDSTVATGSSGSSRHSPAAFSASSSSTSSHPFSQRHPSESQESSSKSDNNTRTEISGDNNSLSSEQAKKHARDDHAVIHPGENSVKSEGHEEDPENRHHSGSDALERLKDLASSSKLIENVGEGFRQHRRASMEEFKSSSGDMGSQNNNNGGGGGSSSDDIPELPDIPELKFGEDGLRGEEVKSEIKFEDGLKEAEIKSKNNFMHPHKQELRGCEMLGKSSAEENTMKDRMLERGTLPLQHIANQQDEFMEHRMLHGGMQGNAIQQFPMQLGPYGEDPHQSQTQMWNFNSHYGGYPQAGGGGGGSDGILNEGVFPHHGGVGMPSNYDNNRSMAPGSSGWWMSVNQSSGGGGGSMYPRAGSPTGFRMQGAPPGSWRGIRPSKGDSRKMLKGDFSPPPVGALIRPSLSPSGLGDPSSPYPPYPSDISSDMMPSPPTPGSRKRGPGRPRVGIPGAAGSLMDPSSSPSGMSGALPDTHPPPGGKTKGSNNSKKRYVCEVCQKRFSTAWYVRVHRKSHNGERPYICHNCGKGFMLPNVLQVHLRKCEKTNNPAVVTTPQTSTPPAPTSLPSNPNLGDPDRSFEQRPPLSPGPGIPLPTPYSEHQPVSGSAGGGHSSLLLPPQQPQNMYGMSYNQRFGGYHHGYPMPGEGSPSPYESQMMMGSYGMPSHHSQQQQQQQQPHMLHGPPPLVENDYSPEMFNPGSAGQPAQPQDHPPKDNISPPLNHFLGDDRPPDEGGGGGGGEGSCSDSMIGEDSPFSNKSIEKTVPPGVDPELYCTSCEIQFDEKASVEEHLKTHRPYMCDVCEKRFSQKCNLITHLRLHTGERPYSCLHCEKRFTQKGNLDAHVKTHTKEKPYPCIQCGKKFSFKSSMISHMKQSHHQLLNTPGISPLSSADFDVEDDISSIKQQLKYGTNGSHHHQHQLNPNNMTPDPHRYQNTPPSPPSNHFSSGIPTPQSSLDSLSGGGGQGGHHFGYPASLHSGAEAAELHKAREDLVRQSHDEYSLTHEDNLRGGGISASSKLLVSPPPAANNPQSVAIS